MKDLTTYSLWLGVHAQLNDIQRQHGSGEARLKAVVKAFLLGEGLYQPSWRGVIHALHRANESHLADQIKSYAEPVQGECVWVINPPHMCGGYGSHRVCVCVCVCLSVCPRASCYMPRI